MERLSDADIERLDQYLAAHCAGAGGLPGVEALDGLLSAVVAGPEPVPPSEWIRVAWGREHAFADEATAREMVELVMRAYNAVVARVRDPAAGADEPGDDVLPLVAWPEFDRDDPDDGPDLDDTSLPLGAWWAHGFGLGRALREQAWARLVDDWDGLDAFLRDIEALIGGLDPGTPDGERLPLGERISILQSIPALLHDLYRDAQLHAAPPPFRREAPKVGRNEPCPCGSGRKYKLCHGRN